MHPSKPDQPRLVPEGSTPYVSTQANSLRGADGDRVTYSDPADPFVRRLAIRLIEQLTGQPRLQRLYDQYLETRRDGDIFWRTAVDYLRLTVRHDAYRLAAIPKEGPLIIVANHPFGVLDGIAIGYLMSRVRTDFKMMAHAALGRATVFRPYLIPVEFDGASTALRENVAAKRAALAHLADGGSLIIFPAGRVSTARNVVGTATDAPWKLFTGKLVAASRATVVPVFFEGQNGLAFHLASQVSETLREALILREVARKIGADITARIGDPLPFDALSEAPTRQALLDRLRVEVYALRGGV